jgi:hypothetical protein
LNNLSLYEQRHFKHTIAFVTLGSLAGVGGADFMLFAALTIEADEFCAFGGNHIPNAAALAAGFLARDGVRVERDGVTAPWATRLDDL